MKNHNDDEDGGNDNTARPEPLAATKFLQELKGKVWTSEDGSDSLTEVQRRLIKRSKLPIIIIDQSSDDFAEYEMLYLITAFEKKEQENLSTEEKNVLRKLVKSLKNEAAKNRS